MVACKSLIYVFEPRFPDQELPKEPALVIDTQPSAPYLLGYLDPPEPHTINNVHVHHLGREEVFAVVRDDGDVDAYFTRHLHEAIQRRKEPDNALGTLAVDIRPFFQDNVGMSAWGLAIHAEARLLAVSSNTHMFTVFAFALTSSDDVEDEADDQEFEANMIEDEDEDEDEDDDSYDDGDEYGNEDEDEDGSDDNPPAPSSRRPMNRNLDRRYEFLAGDQNIPHIAFCNTKDDPEGRWLLSTDINGYTTSWDLFKMSPTQKIRVGSDAVNRTGYDRKAAGWGVMFLDPRSFQEEQDLDTATGLDPMFQRMDGTSALWDLGTGGQTSLEIRQARSSNAQDQVASEGTQGLDDSTAFWTAKSMIELGGLSRPETPVQSDRRDPFLGPPRRGRFGVSIGGNTPDLGRSLNGYATNVRDILDAHGGASSHPLDK